MRSLINDEFDRNESGISMGVEDKLLNNARKQTSKKVKLFLKKGIEEKRQRRTSKK